MRRSFFLSIVAIIVATAIVLALFFGQSPSRRRSITIPSARNATPPGWKAIYLLLERLGHRVAFLGTDWRHLPDATRVLIVGAASHARVAPPTSGEVEALTEWVERGGRLIYAAAPQRGFGDIAFRELEDELGLGRQASATAPSEEPTGWFFGVRPRPIEVTHIGEDPLTAGVATLRVLPGPAFSTLPSEATVLARGPRRETYVAAFPRGKGIVYAISTPSLLSNRLIGEADNLDLSLNLLADASGGRLSAAILFDEFHHGYRAVTAQTLLRSGWFLALALHLMLLTGLFVASAGRRFGLPRPLHVEEHRDSTEYVDSIAGLYRRAHLARDALEILHRRFLDRLRERYGFGKKAERATLTTTIGRRRPDLAHRLDEALDEAERLLGQASPPERAVAACCHRLYALLEDERA